MRIQLGKKGVAFLLGCSLEEVKVLVKEDVLPTYALSDDGQGFVPHPARGGVDLFFDVEDVLSLREGRRKWKRTTEREGDPALLPVCPLPSLGVVAVAQALDVTWPTVRNLVQQGGLTAYVLNQAETGWTRAGSPDVSRKGTLLFLPDDVAQVEQRPVQAESAAVSDEERRDILAVWQSLEDAGTKVTRQILWQAMADQRGWSKQRTTYNKVSTVFVDRRRQRVVKGTH